MLLVTLLTPTGHAATGGLLPTGSMLFARHLHTSTLLRNGQVLIAGGDASSGGSNPLSSSEIYDPTSGTFSSPIFLSGPRALHTATPLPSGHVALIGGYDGTGPYPGGALGTVETYDPDTATFSITGQLITPRYGHTATMLPNGDILIAGGYYISDLASAELYHPPTGTSTPTASMAVARFCPTATRLLDGRVLIAGGGRPENNDLIVSAEVYDPNSGTFSMTGSMTTERPFGTATVLDSGKVLVTGVNAYSFVAGSGPSSEIYDPFSGAFAPTNDMLLPAMWHAATPLPNGGILLTGGHPSDPPVAQLYDPLTGAFHYAGFLVSGRRVLHTSTLLNDGNVLLAGGQDYSNNSTSSAELWNPLLITPPGLFRLEPAFVYQNSPDFMLKVEGWEFTPGTTAFWNGMPLATTFVSNRQLSVLVNSADLAVPYSALITVVAPDGPISKPQALTILDPIDTIYFSSAIVDSYQTGQFFFNGTANLVYGLVNNPSATTLVVTGGMADPGLVDASVVPPIYNQNSFIAFRINGANASTSADMLFTFATEQLSVDPGNPDFTLLYFNGCRWVPVLSSGGSRPVRVYDIYGSAVDPASSSSGYFVVLFDNTSTPTVIDLGKSTPHSVFAYGIVDTSSPQLVCPPDIILTAPPGQSFLNVPFVVLGTDDGPWVEIESRPSSGSAFAIGSTTVTSTAIDSFGNSATCAFRITVLPGTPTIARLSPDTITAGASDFSLIVNGSGFAPDATVRWNGRVLSSVFVNASQLTATVPASEVVGGTEIITALVTVGNTDSTSNPLSFAITPANVTAIQSAVAQVGESISVAARPASATEAGVLATLNNSGGDTVIVTVANYSSNPSGAAFRAAGGFTDLQISGADPADTATASFYYPSTTDAATEASLTLLYFDGSAWVSVRSSDNSEPVKNTGDDLDGTISGGRFVVSFGSSSIPRITELNGTIFASAVPDYLPPEISCSDIRVPASIDALVRVNYPTPTVSDNVDPAPGVSYSIASGSGFPIGTTTVIGTATDAGGNSASTTFTVTRAALGFSGFLSPIGGGDAMGGSSVGPLRTFKSGSTIPVKFTASCGDMPVLTGVHKLQIFKYSAATTAGTPIDATPQNGPTLGNEFRLTDGHWQLNLDTKATGMSPGIYQLIATLSDRSKHDVWIQIK